MSRSMRFTSTHDPKISALSPTPTAKVSGQFDTSVKPWLLSKLTRYALIDHFLRGNTSPVGTYQRPVSPMKVVVAGRVSVSVDTLVDCVVCGAPAGGGCDVVVPVVVPVVVDCAAA